MPPDPSDRYIVVLEDLAWIIEAIAQDAPRAAMREVEILSRELEHVNGWDPELLAMVRGALSEAQDRFKKEPLAHTATRLAHASRAVWATIISPPADRDRL